MFLAGVCESRFPHTTSRGLWPLRVELLPTPLRGDRRDLPELRGHDKPALDAFAKESKAHEQVEELRLGYVAFTRAKHALVVSSYLWTEGRKTPLGPSPSSRSCASSSTPGPSSHSPGTTSRPRTPPIRCAS